MPSLAAMLPALRPRTPRLPSTALTVMLVLTFTTGVVDSVGYLGLDRVFVGNMTGNIVILGMGAAGADDLPVLGPLIALCAFTCAAFLTGSVLRGQPTGWTSRVTWCLSVGAGALAVCSVSLFALDSVAEPGPGQVAVAAISAAAMGAQAAVARKVAVRDMTTVVVTSTLTSLVSESWTSAGHPTVWNRRTAAIAAILLGAIVGATVLRHTHLGIAMGLATLLTAGATATGHLRLRGHVN